MEEYTVLEYRALCPSSDDTCLITLSTRAGDASRLSEVGWIWFVPEGQPLPAPNRDSAGRINLYYRQRQFLSILELLRTEKPVQLFFSGQNEAGLRTGRGDPAAEGECLHALFRHPGVTSLEME